MSTQWLVTDGALWGKLTELRRREIKTWLRMNDVDPASVPVDCAVMLVEAKPGVWEIQFEEYRRSPEGSILVDPSNPNEAYVQERAVPLEVDPPQEWLVPVYNAA